jgi:isoleucyl-tRNA synthetase
LYTVMPALVSFVTQLTNWYVRLNRDRLKGLEGDGAEAEAEAETGLQVLYDVLLDVTIIMAPFTPFISEYFYQHLRKLQDSYNDAENGGGKSNPVMPGKSHSVHFLRLPAYDESRLNKNAVEAMEALQAIVEHGRTVREKRNISLRTPVKNVVAIMRNPPTHVVEGITGSLKKYILSELNAFDFQIVGKEEEHEWVSLSLTLNFSVLGKKLGKKMKPVQKAVQGISHAEAVKCLEDGKLEVEGETLDTKTELLSKLQFAKEGSQWEATVKVDGSLVVAVDCTQDEEILSAGKSRELINGIQQLRKNAGLDLKDAVESFFLEEDGVTIVEDAVSRNVPLFQSKFKGSVPLPQRFAPAWSVLLKSAEVEVGGATVNVSIYRPAIALSDALDERAIKVLSTFEPSKFSEGQSFKFDVDGEAMTLQEGQDFWLSTASKVRKTKSLSWL